jgi:hypothetical protein
VHTCKTRGFTPKEVDWDEIRATFDADCYGTYRYKATRFISLGGAMALAGQKESAPLSLAGSWITQERELNFRPTRRQPSEADTKNLPVRSDVAWCPHRILGRVSNEHEYSDIYVPKQSWDESWDVSDEARFYDLTEEEI